MKDNNILKDRNLNKSRKRGYEMGFGEYASILTFGIISTGAVALRPEELPLLIIGAFIFSLILMKVYNYIYIKIEKSRINFVIFAIFGGIIACIGIWVIMKNGVIPKINGTLWLFMSILIMKYNVDNILE